MTSTTSRASTLQDRLDTVRERVEAAERRSGRPPGSVTLVGVSKTVTRTEVDEAYAAGLRHFGENRVQNALETFAGDLPDDLVLHLIGTLQTNKARFIPGHFDVVHSLDREPLAIELNRRCEAAGKRLPVLIQVNVAREQQKHGCQAEELPALIEATLACPALDLRGFMTMAPLGSDAEVARPVLVAMRELRDAMRVRYPEASLNELSMGMTIDYTAAIEEGATIVRVGRAIFAEPAAG
ncbi:MAG: YggS family pyridoxal phosphate-dependent enzyme [Thermomicrobiales bacterium]